MTPETRLVFLTFPQQWLDGVLHVRILVLPRGNPIDPLIGAAPAFADSNLKLAVRLIPEPGKLPNASDALAPVSVPWTLPANRRALSEKLADMFNIALGEMVEAAPASPPIHKYMPRSFRKAIGRDRSAQGNAVAGDDYRCALHAATEKPAAPPPKPTDEVSWGDVLHYALRQPLLASELGMLLVAAELPVAAGHPILGGGWIYTELDATSDYAAEAAADSDLTASYAALLPSLDDNRDLFAANLFAVATTPGVPPVDDNVLTETVDYQDGFARFVHGAQPDTASVVEGDDTPLPAKDVGIRLGWDDEQVLRWLNRQAMGDPYSPGHTPLGVAGYRVDVRLANSGNDFTSLNALRGVLDLDGIPLGTFDGELNIETVPIRFPNDARIWLPAYFAAWAGGSLVIRDPGALPLTDARPAAQRPANPYTALRADEVQLRYGNDYEFRVRMADLSGGGPRPDAIPGGPGRVSPVVPFRRLVPPKTPSLLLAAGEEVAPDTVTYRVLRPRLGYPEAVFTGAAGTLGALIADLPAAKAEEREASIPDPDAGLLEVRVEVRAPAGDSAPDGYWPLYTTTRAFPAAAGSALQLDLAFVDSPDIASFPAPAAAGPLQVPTARDVRLHLTAIGTARANYYGSEELRRGVAPLVLNARKESADEEGLLRLDTPSRHIRALFFQPDAIEDLPLRAAGNRHAAPSSIGGRLAEETGLDFSGLTLFARKGRRLIVGCSAGLRHVIAPDKSAIQFANRDDLGRRWIIAVQAEIERDWTWDGLNPVAFRVVRTVDGVEEDAGIIEAARAVSPVAVEQADRTRTYLCFFDAIDPKVADPGFPEEIQASYRLVPVFRGVAPVPGLPAWTLRLPVSTAPLQTPKLKSAGIAMSEYVKADDYSSTKPRRKRLWVEFEASAADPKDRYFGRVLAHAVDPLLGAPRPAPPEVREEPLPIDPEPCRVVLPAQPVDENGLNAMQPLTPEKPGSARFLVPLPPGLTEDSLELFGMFTYEFRIGHDAQRWSTARGRFGPPLRVTGVQHPAPGLPCYVRRTETEVHASAPYAAAVQEGYNSTESPTTEVWFLLYAQVQEASGAGWRNVLLSRKRGEAQAKTGNGDVLYSNAAIQLRVAKSILRDWAIARDSALSVLAVELIPAPLVRQGGVVAPDFRFNRYADPLGADLGQVRILRTSPLIPVPPAC